MVNSSTTAEQYKFTKERSMKKIACLAMGAAMLMAAPISAMAAGEGTTSDPKTDLPNTEELSMGIPGTEISEALKIKCLETEGDKKNTLQLPTKGTIECTLTIAQGTKLMIDNVEVKDNSEGGEPVQISYTFDAGKQYRLKIVDGSNADNIGVWDLNVPSLDKENPLLKVSGQNLREEDGKIYSEGTGFLSKELNLNATDGTGIKCIYWIPYTDASFEQVDEYQTAGIYYDKSHPEFIPTGDITYNGTVIHSKGSDVEDLSDFGNVKKTNGLVSGVNASKRFEKNSWVLMVLEDVYGNQSKFQLYVTGISQINDSAAPKAAVEKTDISYESDGKTVKSVNFKLRVDDAPAGLDYVKAKLGETEILNMEGLKGQASVEKEFTVNKTDANKVLQIMAKDINGNALGESTAYTVDLSSYFNGDDGDGGDGGSSGSGSGSSDDSSSSSGTEDVKPSFSASYNKTIENGKVTKVDGSITFTSPNGLKKIEIWNGTSKLVSSDITDGKTSATFNYTLDAAVQNKTLKLYAEDTKGNKLEDTLDLSEQFNNGSSGGSSSGGSSSGSSESQITSNSQLKKALGDPIYEYDEEETTVTFKLDKSKTGDIDPSWTLKNPSGKTIDESESEGVYTFSYTFEEGEDKPGNYSMRVEDKDGHKATVDFYVDYRDDTDVAQALKIEKELDEDTKKVTIKLSLDKDKVDESGEARWTWYKDSSYEDIQQTEEGRSAEFEVTKDGTYYFKVKCDGETFKFKVYVTEFEDNDIDTDKESSGSSSNSNSNSNSNSQGDKPTDVTDNKVPQPVGTPVVSNVTATTQTITITMTDWNKDDWKINANSFPSGVSYMQPSGTNDIVLTVPNANADINFIMENVKTNKQIKLTVKTYEKNIDGTDKNSNVTTGGATGMSVLGGTLAYDFKPMDLTFRRKKDGSNGDEGNDFID